MKSKLAYLAIVAAALALGEDTASITNRLIVSDEIESRGWAVQHVMADSDNRPVNDQGKLVAHADAVAMGAVAGEIAKQAETISNAMFSAVGALLDVTNRIPKTATHLALYLPRFATSKNLAGEVIAEYSDGITDTQTVRYNQRLALPPNRSVEYVYNDTTTRVASVWATPWDTNALEHVCTIPRPAACRNVRALTYRHERFGGAAGFDFGSALVTVDGAVAFTGVITNAATGAIMEFRNGIYLKKAKEIDE